MRVCRILLVWNCRFFVWIGLGSYLSRIPTKYSVSDTESADCHVQKKLNKVVFCENVFIMNSVGCEKSKTEWNNLRFKAEEKQASTLAPWTYWLACVITLLKCVIKDLRLVEPENIWSVCCDYRHTDRYPNHIWFIPTYEGGPIPVWWHLNLCAFFPNYMFMLHFQQEKTSGLGHLNHVSVNPAFDSFSEKSAKHIEGVTFTLDVSGSREPSSCPARHFLETPRLSLQPPPLQAPGRCGGAGRSCDWRACRQSCRSPGTSSPQFCWD